MIKIHVCQICILSLDVMVQEKRQHHIIIAEGLNNNGIEIKDYVIYGYSGNADDVVY